jgi:uncharacterized protein (UPF0548 family)
MSLPLSLRRPSADALARFVAEQRQLDVTYADVGATRTGADVPKFTVDAWSVELGAGDAVFARARDGIRAWAAHAAAGVAVTPSDTPIAEGETVAFVARTGGLYMRAACRIVWTVDDDDAFGFGYGTLPGHPECGEESFVVRRRADESIVFEVNAISRPRHPLARLGGPITRALQVRAARRYLTGMQRWIVTKS